ncbi:cytochrome P450 [Thermobifida halotolerans]|uniref:Cytochrome P450 n=1 Tax=Thermobifida halotolerans TaxID=483545 RepID=A0AA97M5X4_9ACTN|nr:cytochrome P450 [Thermobifida halotolerans]UOE21550.1 cytochrome P450 [Thermobifida halotolerans]
MSHGLSRPRPTPGPTPPVRCPVHAQAVPLYKSVHRPDHALLWEELRARFGTVAPVEIRPGVPGWLLLGYHENLNVLRNPASFATDPARWRESREERQADRVHGAALAVDGERHRRMRAPIVEGLRALSGRRLTGAIKQTATSLIDRFATRGQADLIADYAVPLPAMVLNFLFGLDTRYGDLLARLCAARNGGDPDTAARAAADIHRYVTALVERRRAEPGDDFVSRLLAHPAGLTDDEVAAELTMLLRAGVQPTAHLVGNALRLLLTRSEVATAYRGAALPSVDFLDYVMWADPPLQTLAARYPTRDVRIGGADIKEGEALVLGFAPAHADPATRRGDRDAFDALVGNRAHLMWGAGPHGCPAQALACEIAITAIDTLIDRLDPVLDGTPDDLRWRASLSVHGLVSLPVTFRPEPAPAVPEQPAPRARRRLLPVRAGRPRAQGARYSAPGAAIEDTASRAASARHARVGTPTSRATGARYHVPAAEEARPDPLEGLLTRWG